MKVLFVGRQLESLQRYVRMVFCQQKAREEKSWTVDDWEMTDAQTSDCRVLCLYVQAASFRLIHARIRLAVSTARWFAACTYLTVGHAVLHVGGAAVVAALEVRVVRCGAVERGVGHVCC